MANACDTQRQHGKHLSVCRSGRRSRESLYVCVVQPLAAPQTTDVKINKSVYTTNTLGGDENMLVQ